MEWLIIFFHSSYIHKAKNSIDEHVNILYSFGVNTYVVKSTMSYFFWLSAALRILSYLEF